MRDDQERIEGYAVLFLKEYVKMSSLLTFRFRAVRPDSIHATKASVERISSGGVRLVTEQPSVSQVDNILFVRSVFLHYDIFQRPERSFATVDHCTRSSTTINDRL